MTSYRNAAYRYLLLCIFFMSASISLATTDGFDAEQGTFDNQAMIEKLVDLIETHYVIDEKIPHIIRQIREQQGLGRYGKIKNEKDFARILSKDLRAFSDDRHMYVKTTEGSRDRNPLSWEEIEKQEEIDTNYGFSHTQTFPGGIGYIKISSFMEPQRSHQAAISALNSVASAKAIIFDLRGNRGGYGGLPSYLASYFFEPGPTHLATHYYREEGTKTHQDYFTLPAVSGQRRLDVPVFILIDNVTASAAEWFAYIMQSFNKATIVGERSAGAANNNSFYDLSETMRVSISTGRPVSVKTNENWEGRGVIPDVRINTKKALDFALKTASDL